MTEFVSRPAEGRRYTHRRQVRLSDAGLDGVLRLDGLARYLQDAASDDWADSGLDQSETWVVRRTALRLAGGGRWPELGEQVALTTWCAGTGAAWAERRTDIEVDSAVVIEAVGAVGVLGRRRAPLASQTGLLRRLWRGRYGSARVGTGATGARAIELDGAAVGDPPRGPGRHRPRQQRRCVGGCGRGRLRQGGLGRTYAPRACGDRSGSRPGDRAGSHMAHLRHGGQGFGRVRNRVKVASLPAPGLALRYADSPTLVPGPVPGRSLSGRCHIPSSAEHPIRVRLGGGARLPASLARHQGVVHQIVGASKTPL